MATMNLVAANVNWRIWRVKKIPRFHNRGYQRAVHGKEGTFLLLNPQVATDMLALLVNSKLVNRKKSKVYTL